MHTTEVEPHIRNGISEIVGLETHKFQSLMLREFCNLLPETRELQVTTVTASCTIVDEMINNGKSDMM